MAIRHVAAIQMAIREGDPARNRETLVGWLDSAPGADLYLAPELWSSGYAHGAWAHLADEDTPSTLEWMGEQARARGAWLGGSIISRHASGDLVNRFVLFDRTGRMVGHYDKSHLFAPMAEDLHLRAGDALPVFALEGLRVAPAICYDLRFPEMFRRQALRGIDLFLVPSEWPHPREAVMRTLAEARAIENQAFLLLANRVGPGDGGDFCGSSGLFGPTGVMQDLRGPAEGPVRAEIDLAVLDKARQTLRIWDERQRGIDFE